VRNALRRLREVADRVAVGLLTAMFLAFVVQVVARYVFNHPFGWTLEACLTTWLWLVFWASAFVLDDGDHVKFDMFHHTAGRRVQRAFALVSALAIIAGFVASLPATLDYITFYKIKSSATLGLRLDVVFSVYALFAVATIVRYGWRAWRLARGQELDGIDGGKAA